MRLLTLLLLISLNGWAQTVRNVYCAEYGTFYETSAGRVTLVTWNGSNYVATDMGLTNIVAGAGAQYGCVVANNSGQVWTITNTGTTTQITTDQYGRSVTGASKPFGLWQGYGYLKNDSIFTFGQDLLNINSGSNITQPIRLNNPSGRTVTKVITASIDTYVFLALCSDGTVWKYSPAGGKTPTQITGFTGAVTDIASIGQVAYVVCTTSKLYTWTAAFYDTYLGVSNVTTPTEITSNWTSVGVAFPLKQLIGNYYTLHVIDANNNWFSAGQTMNGEAAVGNEYPIWRTYKNGTSNLQFHDDISRGQRVISPTQIGGAKVDTLWMGTTYVFYGYARDMGDSLYSWGRNKTQSLGNGLTVSDSAQSDYNAWGNIPAPRYVNPLYTTWTFAYGGSKGSGYMFNPNSALPPKANAGINQYITSSSTTLYGQGSSQQEYSISSYLWSKVSGSGGTITSPTSQNTTVTGLSTGTYVFKLKVTNSNAVSDSITVQVVVDLPTSSGCQISNSMDLYVNYKYSYSVPCEVKYVKVKYSEDNKNWILKQTSLTPSNMCAIQVKKKDKLYVRTIVYPKVGLADSTTNIF